MKTSVNEKVKTRTKSNVDTSELVHAEVSRGAIRALSTVGVLIGLWAAASIIGGIIVSGGFMSLLKGWFSAVTGM